MRAIPAGATQWFRNFLSQDTSLYSRILTQHGVELYTYGWYLRRTSFFGMVEVDCSGVYIEIAAFQSF